MPTLLFWRQQPMPPGNVACMLGEPVGTEHFPPDRTDELSVTVIAAAEKAEKSALRFFGRYYSRRH